MQNAEFCKGESYVSTLQKEPTPLFGEMRPAEPVPLAATGPLAETIMAIATLTQAPVEIAMQSVLAVASTATQALCDVETLGGTSPISLFAMTIARSGERKSACDSLAIAPILQVDRERNTRFCKDKKHYEVKRLEFLKRQRTRSNGDFDVIDDGYRGSKEELGPEPPLVSAMLVSDATTEGICRRLEIGTPSITMMTDEGGQIIGGYAMKPENALKSSAAFSNFWDGKPVSRSRASSEPTILYGKRLSMHLMVQPGVAQGVLGNPVIKDQGLLSRMLVVWPESKIGNRLIVNDPARVEKMSAAQETMNEYVRRIEELLNVELPLHPGTRSDLSPRVLKLSDAARAKLVAFYNNVEKASRKGGAFEYITGLAAKAPEHAARIAAVLALYADETTEEVTEEMISRGISLMTWYLAEMLRIHDTGCPNVDLRAADELRCWIVDRRADEFIDKRSMLKFGPGHLRDGKTLDTCIRLLVQHGWLVRGEGKQKIDGAVSHTFWRTVRSSSL